ncbi:MAG: hypothetical protein NXI32_27550 [bacterium]|nr:hypothetical protein [bacterium]
MRFISRFFSKMWENVGDGFDWLIYQMDVTQWGIVAALFVVTGFMALKTKF